MTQPQPVRNPELPPHNPKRNPFDQAWLDFPVPHSLRDLQQRKMPEVALATKRFGPLDLLANQLSDLGLHVRRDSYADGTTWAIVANETDAPYREVRVNVGPRASSERVEKDLLVIHVGRENLTEDCGTAFIRAKRFIQENG